jgi:hypothetical protein
VNSSRGSYSTSLGHILNWWHYRRTDNTLEQVYLSGMTNAENAAEELIERAWSWLAAPGLHMDGFEPSYAVTTYDQAQRAYIVPKQGLGPAPLEFTLAHEDMDQFTPPQWVVNPAFIVKDWGEGPVP